VQTAEKQPETEDRLFQPTSIGAAGRGVDLQRLTRRLAHGALRGAIAAMAMTGLREFTRHAGPLDEPPPEAIGRQKLSRRFLRTARRGPRRAQAELAHWAYGAAAGGLFAAMPGRLRGSPWSGPVYGLLVWGGFELGVAPLLALSQARRSRPLDRLALACDHLFYGFLLSEDATLRSVSGAARCREESREK
jgi:hypothetical protein